MADAAQIRQTIETYWAAFSADDRARFLGCFADGAWIEDPVGTPRRQGIDDIGAFYDQSHGLADSIELRGTKVNVCGDEAVFHMEIRPTIGGTEMLMDCFDHMTFDDDARIVTMRAFWDPAEMRPAE